MAIKPRSVVPAIAPPGTNFPVIKDKAIIAKAEIYATKKAEIASLEAEVKALRPDLLAAMGGAPTAYAGTRVLSLNEVSAIPATENVKITRDMVGQVIPGKKGRAGYSTLEVR